MTTENAKYNWWVKTAAWAATASAVVFVVIKLYAWLVSDASAMLASATDSMLDLFASAVNLIILRFSLAPPDKEHKFGHGKAESLAGLVQSAFIIGSSILLIFTAFERIVSPRAITNTTTAIVVTLTTIAVTLALVSYQRYVIKKTQSVAIGADSLHYQSDLLLNLGVLAALLLNNQIWPYADGVFTLLVGLYLMFGAGKIIWRSLYQLMDHELSEQELEIIKQAVIIHPKALGYHELRTRKSGPTRFIQFHLELEDDLSLVDAHAIGLAIEKQIKQALSPCEVFIHHDPSSVVQEELRGEEQQ